ncbi:LysR substrate-binding domain-containing protein [Roseibacterium beibuensis]|nr:LysR substrate-binding domain-containing protein [Roseibacterium beibuensis]
MVIPHALSLRHVRVFLAIAEAGTVSAAARRLHVSQPALSKTLADIERIVGHPLFDRTGRKMTLTVPGTLFRRHALDAVHSLESGLQAISGDGATETLSVGLLPTVAASLFPDVARRYAHDRPASVISVTTGPHGYLLDRLRRGDIDLMVGRMPEPSEMAGLRFAFLYEDSIELVARAGHPGLKTDVAEAVRANPVILPTRESIIRKIVDGFLAAQGLADLRPILETVSPNLALPLLLDTDMLWFISRGVVARELSSGNLSTFDLGAGYMSGAVGITLRQGAETTANADYLIELLHAAASN